MSLVSLILRGITANNLLCLLTFFLATSYVANAIPLTVCPNMCSTNGICTNGSAGECVCFPGFHGVDCSIRICPAGKAWADLPSASNVAHQDYAECSNMGDCDRSTGYCNCRYGFGGPACDTMLCPVDFVPTIEGGTRVDVCSGNGACISLGDSVQDDGFYNSTASSGYGYTYRGWDANMIYGCTCDTGWEGVNCDRRSCPKGDDPLTPGVPEVQLIECKCNYCRGGVYITYDGQQTNLIPYNAAEEVVAYFLSQLSNIVSAKVQLAYGNTLCSAAGSVTRITFLIPQGPQMPLQLTQAGGLTGVLQIRYGGMTSLFSPTVYSQSATTEYMECSNRGTCDYTTGTCLCFAPFESSNGMGSQGSTGDCGYRYATFVVHNNAGGNINSSCPFVNNAVCSGHGYCTEPSGICTCTGGYSTCKDTD